LASCAARDSSLLDRILHVGATICLEKLLAGWSISDHRGRHLGEIRQFWRLVEQAEPERCFVASIETRPIFFGVARPEDNRSLQLENDELLDFDRQVRGPGARTEKCGRAEETWSTSTEGHLLVSARDGADTVTVAEGVAVGASAKIALGDGDNSATVAGTIDGNLAYDGADGNDSVTLAETAMVAANFFARLDDGDNIVTHAGTVEGNSRVVSANEEDTVNIADTAVIGGETDLGLGEQKDRRGRCHRIGGGFEALLLNGRQLGFFNRRLRR
jgi:hypothetical protein